LQIRGPWLLKSRADFLSQFLPRGEAIGTPDIDRFCDQLVYRFEHTTAG
jgi:hypothetical protein